MPTSADASTTKHYILTTKKKLLGVRAACGGHSGAPFFYCLRTCAKHGYLAPAQVSKALDIICTKRPEMMPEGPRDPNSTSNEVH